MKSISSHGLLITFEGCDGGGKTTQLRRLAERLQQEHWPFLKLREPGGTDISEAIRAILLKKSAVSLFPETELLLFAASRAQLVREVMEPALQTGKIVLCDRFMDSTTVYQGVARCLSMESVQAINSLAIGAVKPHLTFVLDITPEVSRQRLLQRNLCGMDRMEEEDVAFYTAVREGYLRLAAENSDRMMVIDANQEESVIANLIWERVKMAWLAR